MDDGIRLEPEQRYWLALGHFVDAFAFVEALVFETLCAFAGLDLRRGAAVFSGTRTDAALGFMTRLVEAAQLSEAIKKELDYIRAQLSAINKFRNNILHYGVGYEETEDKFAISTLLRSHTEKHGVFMYVPIETLNDATFDLLKMQTHLCLLRDRVRGESDDPSPEDREDLDAPWRYKPPVPVQLPHMNRD